MKKEEILKIKLNYLKMNNNFLAFIIILIYSNINAQNIDSKFNLSKATAEFKNGLLKVVIPFAKGSEPKTLKIS